MAFTNQNSSGQNEVFVVSGSSKARVQMFQHTTYEDFIKLVRPGSTSVLFIKEKGCRYCERAESELKDFFAKTEKPPFDLYQTTIEEEPALPAKLGLIGVPAFLRIDSNGRRMTKTGFEGIEDLKTFVLRS